MFQPICAGNTGSVVKKLRQTATERRMFKTPSLLARANLWQSKPRADSTLRVVPIFGFAGHPETVEHMPLGSSLRLPPAQLVFIHPHPDQVTHAP